MVDFYGKCSYINLPYSHPMGIVWYCIVVDVLFILDLFNLIFEKVSLPHSPSKKSHMLFLMRFDLRINVDHLQDLSHEKPVTKPYSQISKPTHFPGINRHIVKKLFQGGGVLISSLAHIVFRFMTYSQEVRFARIPYLEDHPR